MENSEAISNAIKLAFAAVNVVVWTGLFLFALRLDRKLRALEDRED